MSATFIEQFANWIKTNMEQSFYAVAGTDKLLLFVKQFVPFSTQFWPSQNLEPLSKVENVLATLSESKKQFEGFTLRALPKFGRPDKQQQSIAFLNKCLEKPERNAAAVNDLFQTIKTAFHGSFVFFNTKLLFQNTKLGTDNSKAAHVEEGVSEDVMETAQEILYTVFCVLRTRPDFSRIATTIISEGDKLKKISTVNDEYVVGIVKKYFQ